MRRCIPLMMLLAVSSAKAASPAAANAALPNTREITNEVIRDAIMNVVHILRDSGDKLERHEYRERQLGEQLKKALGGLDKRHRVSDHAVEGIAATLAKLDERLRNVETMITQRDERERIQLQKTQNIMEGIQGSLSSWMKEMGDIVKGGPAKNEGDVNIAVMLERLEQAVLRSNDASTDSEMENLRAATAKLSTTDAKMKHSVVETERILSQYEARLGELRGSSSTSKLADQHDWHPIFLNALESHEKVLQDLREMTRGAGKDLSELPRRSELVHATNTTNDLLQEIKYHLEAHTEKAVAKLENRLQDSQASLGRGQEEILKTVTDASVMTESLYGDVTKSYDQLLKEVQGLAKVEQVMIQTADNVMDTKRRIEYGVHQILLEVGDLVKLQSKELNTTINRRFDNISTTILDNHAGALTNLSTKIETEISQVWRQIGIMYQQLTASAAVLDHLQQQTEIYVNGSLRTMDSMEGKVGLITGRMREVDDNLNYLLGRLSLVTQEFNMIKSGLGTALDNIRNSFLSVQEKIRDVGPGPNPIPDNEVIPPSSDNQVPPLNNVAPQ